MQRTNESDAITFYMLGSMMRYVGRRWSVKYIVYESLCEYSWKYINEGIL